MNQYCNYPTKDLVLKKDIDVIIRHHYFRDDCDHRIGHEHCCQSILYDIMKLIDYQDRSLKTTQKEGKND